MELETDSLPIDPYTRQILPGGIAVFDHLGVMVAWLPVPPRDGDDASTPSEPG